MDVCSATRCDAASAREPHRARGGESGASVVIGGAGLSGAVIARVAAERGHSVLVLEQRDVVGGNCADFVDDNGLLVPSYGPHYFHVPQAACHIIPFLERFATWEQYEPHILAVTDELPLAPSCQSPFPEDPDAAAVVTDWEGHPVRIVPLPPSRATINALFGARLVTDADTTAWLARETAPYNDACGKTATSSEQSGMSRVGRRLYDALFRHYSSKQWGRPMSEVGASVLARIPCRVNDDTRYFSDPWQAVPRGGYSAWIAAMLDHPLIDVRCGTDYAAERHTFASAPHKFFSGRIDSYYADRGLDPLEYRTLDFDFKSQAVETREACALPSATLNFPTAWARHTRINEPKHVLAQVANKPATTLIYEYSRECRGFHDTGYYPVDAPRNVELLSRYQAIAAADEDAPQFVGRLGGYRYIDMWRAVSDALEIAGRTFT